MTSLSLLCLYCHVNIELRSIHTKAHIPVKDPVSCVSLAEYSITVVETEYYRLRTKIISGYRSLLTGCVTYCESLYLVYHSGDLGKILQMCCLPSKPLLYIKTKTGNAISHSLKSMESITHFGASHQCFMDVV